MFLITTADQRTWDDKGKILFLGEWCKRYSQRKAWSKLDHEVVPYHWDDRQCLYHDYRYLQKVYKRYLKALSLQLNTIHHVQFDVRYWQILVGYWLNSFISILFDRFQSIQAAVQYRQIANTKIIEYPENKIVPKDMIHFKQLFQSDAYNHYLYSKIISFSGNIPYQTLSFEYNQTGENFSIPASIPMEEASWKVSMKRLFKFYNKLPFPWSKNYVFFSSGFGYRREMLLQCLLGQIPLVKFSSFDIPYTELNPNMRNGISFNLKNNDFEDCLEYLLPKQIPFSYMEGYQMLRSYALKRYQVKNPKLIFSTVGFNVNDDFKCWAAEKSEEGTKLVAGQHGGSYGMSLWYAMEEHEIGISDQYFSWGWTDDQEPKVLPVPASKLISKQHKIKPSASGKILWVSLMVPRYSYFMFSGVVASQWLYYLKEQQRFLTAVCPSVHDQLLLRLAPHDTGWDAMERWQEFDPSLNVYQGNCSFEKQLNESRLCISTYNATTYLETFAANYPTVIFWNPEYWEIRSSTVPYFERLREVGILHDNPESAAALVNEIFQNPWLWWTQTKVQNAKNEFCQKFALTSQSWLTQWRKSLIECRKN
jgi:putative transferase (TIGR04331 family)